jgi:hypothetical protein
MSHSFVFDNKDDPVLVAIAQELHTSLNSQPITTTTNSNNNNNSESDLFATTLHAYQFRLESFLTRPRTCTTLFPPRVQKSRYSQILVQERLVLLSAAATAATVPSSYLSTITDTDTDTDKDTETDKEKESQDVLIAGLEVLEYTLTPFSPSPSGDKPPRPQKEERIIYIAKVDTSGFWPLPGLETASLRGKSPAQALVKGYLRSVRVTSRLGLSPISSTSASTDTAASGITDTGSSISDNNSNNSAAAAAAGKMSALSITPTSTPTSTTLYRSRPQKTSLYIFARAQPQYLFAESAKNPQKRVLDDRGLVRWWKNTAASVYADSLEEASPPVTATTTAQGQEHEEQGKESVGERQKKGTKVQGWWHIPGIETERQAHNVIQSITTPSSSGSFKWTYGYPDKDSKELANALIPQFPDDPKSRMMQSPSCQGGFVNIRTFWELAAIGEESGAGKITGFFRVEEEADDGSEGEDEAEADNGVRDVKEKAVTGTTAGYTKVINFLLDLDFSTLESARKSTRTWQDRVAVWIQKSVEREAEHALEVEAARRQEQQQQSEVEKDDRTKEEKKEGDVVAETRPLWIQKGTIEILLRHASEAPTLTPTKTTAAAVSPAETVPASAASPVVVNTLGVGLIKRKAPTPTSTTITGSAAATAPAVNVLGAGLIRRKVTPTSTATTPAPSAVSTPALTTSPAVNVLGAGLIKRKVAPTSTSSTPDPTSPASETSSTASVVNVLGASLIKKRKTDS